MADSVFLSCWLRGFTEYNMLDLFERILGRFPASPMKPGVTLTIYAIDYSEPPLLDQRFESFDAAEIAAACREFSAADCAYQLETHWNLWQFDREWKLGPSPVTITLYGPLFPSDLGEQFRADLGLDGLFLPEEGEQRSLTAVRSNIRSVLRLADEIEDLAPVDKRALWSDFGENLAERLQEALAD